MVKLNTFRHKNINYMTGRLNMKIDRIIFCLNDNDIYTSFWNKVSEVWARAFNIKPTLFFVGSEENLTKHNLSTKYGEIYFLPKKFLNKKNVKRDWSVTWALFYGATMFPNDVCITSGIDQIPLGEHIFENLKEISNDSYVICFSDAYRTPNLFPSSHHVAKGSMFKEIYNIDDDWGNELEKVYNKHSLYKLEWDDWGLDEAYSSELLLQKKSTHNLIFWKGFFHNIWVPRRLDRCIQLNYDIDLLQRGWYSELHSPRPYEEYKDYINTVIYDRYGF